MRKSDLDFWQGMAAHYSKFMRRSAPIYAEICNHIRPHLTRDMNVLELACGTGQLSFPLSPYVRLWEATDASSKMIAEAKKQTGSSRLHFSVQDASRLPYASETFDAVVIANACISYRSRKGFAGSSESPKAGWVAIRSYFYPRWGETCQPADLGYGADRLSRLPLMERRGIHCLSFVSRFLGDGTHSARGACTAFVLCGGQEVTARMGRRRGHRRCMTVARLLIINECGLFV